jgi:MFS family permease
MGSFAITSLITRPFVGRFADRHGARSILLIGSAIGLGSMLLLWLGPETVATVLFSRLVLGAAGAALFTGTALLSIVLAPPGRQGQGASLMLVSVHAGLGIGPVLGIRVHESFGYDGVWVTVAITSALAGLVMALLDRPTPGEHREPGPLIHRAALLPGAVTFFGVIAFNGFLTFASLYGREVGVADVALLFTAASGTIVVVRIVAGHVPDLIGPVRAGTGALLLTVVATVVLALWQTPAGAYLGAILLAGGISLQTPSFMPLAVAGVAEHERGSAMATFTGFFDIAGAVVGPMVGLIVAGAGYQTAFLVTGAMSLVSLALLRGVLAPRWRATQAPASVARNPSSA